MIHIPIIVRILAICDKVEPVLYGPSINKRVGDVDLIISCGDLPFYYIDYVTSMVNRSCYFVFGNHGKEVEYQGKDWTQVKGPPGAVNLHTRHVREYGLLIMGLEGSIRYNNAPNFQYTDAQMWLNIIKSMPGLLYNRLRYGRWLDILVAHSPPFGIHDEEDRAHQGFQSFLPFMRWFKPRYLLHGHIHIYRRDTVTQTRYCETEVINVYPYKILEL